MRGWSLRYSLQAIPAVLAISPEGRNLGLIDTSNRRNTMTHECRLAIRFALVRYIVHDGDRRPLLAAAKQTG